MPGIKSGSFPCAPTSFPPPKCFDERTLECGKENKSVSKPWLKLCISRAWCTGWNQA